PRRGLEATLRPALGFEKGGERTLLGGEQLTLLCLVRAALLIEGMEGPRIHCSACGGERSASRPAIITALPMQRPQGLPFPDVGGAERLQGPRGGRGLRQGAQGAVACVQCRHCRGTGTFQGGAGLVIEERRAVAGKLP